MTFLEDRSFSTLSSSRNWNSPTDREPKTAIFRFFNALDIVGCKMRERTCLAKARIWHLSKQTYTKEMVAHGDLYTVTSQRLPVRSPTFLCMPRCNRTTTNQNQFSYLAIKRFFFLVSRDRSLDHPLACWLSQHLEEWGEKLSEFALLIFTVQVTLEFRNSFRLYFL